MIISSHGRAIDVVSKTGRLGQMPARGPAVARVVLTLASPAL